MNILLINKFYFEKGGAERYFFDLKKLLESKGHTVVPFAMQHKKNSETEYSKYFVSEIRTKPSWNILQNFRTIFRFWWSYEARQKIKELLAENKIDVAHLNNIYHQISPSILPIFKKNKIPIIMTVHDYSLISPNYNLFLNNKIYDKICGKQYYKCLFDKCVNNSSVQSFISVIEMYLHHKILKVY
ncbi:glycosyltransferase, partial [Patescibacteria group bacterium]|nr:glycosyltransferase [Patescibacteria group bacterium]